MPNRAVPPFPWDSLREIVTSGGYYSSDTTAKQVIGGGSPDPVRWQSIKYPERALVERALRRAFKENRDRHRLTAAHWKIFMACELGFVEQRKPSVHGPQVTKAEMVLYDVDHPENVMPDDVAARTFGISMDRIGRYHTDARRAVEDEWAYLHSGLE